jgi:hypothetical protein
MIRPQAERLNEFTLDGREIDSRFENPFVKKSVTDADKKNLKPNLVPILKKPTVKKTEQAKKVEAKKKGLQVSVVNRDERRPMDSETDAEYMARVNNQNNNKVANNENKKQTDAEKEAEKNKKRSLAEFVDLLTDPKPERIGQLVTAIKNGDIETRELYNFLDKMMSSDKPNVQSVGIYLAYYVPTVESFKMVVLHQEKLNPEVKAYSDQFLTSFNQPSKLPVLAQALQSNDIKVVLKAGEVVIFGLQNIKNGQTIDYGARSNRGNNEVKSSSFLGYFMPIAELLKSSQDQTVASLGNSLAQQLSQIGSTP